MVQKRFLRNSGKILIDISSLQAGVYFLLVKENEIAAWNKFLMALVIE